MQAANFLRTRRVEKDVEGVRAFAQEVGSAATDYDCVALFSNPTGDLLHHGNHAIGIESLIAQG